MKRLKSESYTTYTPKSYPSKETSELFEAILSLKNLDDAKNFFRDLLTMAEIEEFTHRWQMVQMLVDGKPYLEIAQTLGTSTTTVARVAHWLFDGYGGYALAVARLRAKQHTSTNTNRPKNTVEHILHDIARLRK